jgi:hypothetical protein
MQNTAESKPKYIEAESDGEKSLARPRRRRFTRNVKAIGLIESVHK